MSFRLLCAALFLLHSITAFAKTTVDEVCRRIDQNHVQFIHFTWTSVHGALKQITLPALDQNALKQKLTDGIFFDGSSIPGYHNKAERAIAESDLLLKPDLESLIVMPQHRCEPGQAYIMCDVFIDDFTPHASDPRSMLKDVLRRAKHDYRVGFYTGVELEFFIFAKNNDRIRYCDQHAYCDAETSKSLQTFKQDLIIKLLHAGIPVEKLHHEVAAAQSEIVLRYQDALKTADHLVLMKHIITQEAEAQGLRVTFMPKPIFGINGSGLHIHFSAYDLENGQNAFANKNHPYYLSEFAQSFLAGVLRNIVDCSIFFNGQVNSFKRLVQGYEAPVYVCWAAKNRSALIRIPQINRQSMSAVRAELRCPDPSCNPYLAFTALLSMGLNGTNEQLSLIDPVEDNLYRLSLEQLKEKGISTLAHSLAESCSLCRSSKVAHQAFGTAFLQEFLRTKQEECDNYNTAKKEFLPTGVNEALAISDWEITHYL